MVKLDRWQGIRCGSACYDEFAGILNVGDEVAAERMTLDIGETMSGLLTARRRPAKRRLEIHVTLPQLTSLGRPADAFGGRPSRMNLGWTWLIAR
jgi:hypothetical protein